MTEPGSEGDSAGYRTFISIDHTFIDDESDGLTQAVYWALGALDSAWPQAVSTVASSDLELLVDAADRWAGRATPSPEQVALQAAVRRLRHLLERD
ncbi:MAG TPA: hypothetical protein VGF46_01865 [Gaiellales bacterium]